VASAEGDTASSRLAQRTTRKWSERDSRGGGCRERARPEQRAARRASSQLYERAQRAREWCREFGSNAVSVRRRRPLPEVAMRSLTVLIAVKLTSLVLVSARTHHRHRRVFAAGTRPWPREDGPRPSAAVAGPSANAVGATSVRGELAVRRVRGQRSAASMRHRRGEQRCERAPDPDMRPSG